jgi:transcriptional regulator with XRE-family HTH domain
MQLHEKATHFNLVLLNPLAGLEMDPGTALDETFKLFNLKAKTIAASSGVSEQQLSKFRNGHQDMHARGLFRVVSALPRSARFHFYSLIEPDIEEASPPPRPALAPAVPIARELPGTYATSANPPSAYTPLLWQRLAIHRLSPTELKRRLEAIGLSAHASQSILEGRAPTESERQFIDSVFAEGQHA